MLQKTKSQLFNKKKSEEKYMVDHFPMLFPLLYHDNNKKHVTLSAKTSLMHLYHMRLVFTERVTL